MAGYDIIEIPSGADGRLDLDALRAVVGEDTLCDDDVTNPNTLGLFEQDIAEASDIVHAAGGQMYYDGANFNAIIGRTNPGLMGFDAVHYNLHKTFSQPHGGGGPGSGPIGVKSHLADFLQPPSSDAVSAPNRTLSVSLVHGGTSGRNPHCPSATFSSGTGMLALSCDAGPSTGATGRSSPR